MWIESEQHSFEVPRSQYEKPALNSEYQEPQFGESLIRDFDSYLTRYSCCCVSKKDNVRRVAFCEKFINHLDEDKMLDLHLVFSNEATFHLSGIINKKNM
jgi:hypothetical protein